MSRLKLRFDALPEDVEAVRRMAEGTNFFRQDEVDIAVELVQDRLDQGDASEYFFIFAEEDGKTVGYTCYGPIGCTIGSYDLYWIIVDAVCQGQGLGRRLMDETERLVHERGGRSVYVETSNRPQYLPTRHFYEKCGYVVEAILPDYYDAGDDKVILRKKVDQLPSV